jgi:hypothetical protein
LFLTHIGPLREINSAAAQPLYFFAVRPRVLRSDEAWGNYELSGDRYAYSENEPNGLVFEYRLAEKGDRARAVLTNASGSTVRQLDGTSNAGMNRIVWDGRDAQGRLVAPGEYAVQISSGGATKLRTAQLLRPIR